MTPEEYQTRLDALKKQELELAQEFLKDNPFKELEGKFVNLTIGCTQQKVLYAGARIHSDRPTEPSLFFHWLKKDGTARKNDDNIPVRFYDGKTYKIEKL